MLVYGIALWQKGMHIQKKVLKLFNGIQLVFSVG